MRPIRDLIPAAALVPLALLASGCGRASADRGTETTDSAGVMIVRSLSADLPLRLGSVQVRALGGKETDEESFYSVSSWNVGTDGTGNIYVLDSNAFAVQVFDSAGRHIRTLGRKGGGPGELQFPFALAVADDGQTRVVDVGNRALVRWGPDGEVLASEPVPTGYTGGALKWTPSGMVVPLRGGPGGQRLAVVPALGELTVLAALPRTEVKAIQLESCGMGFSGMPPIFSPNLVWGAWGNTVVVAKNPEYVLDVYEGGRLFRSVRREVPPRPASAELAKTSLGDGMRVRVESGERVCDPAEVVEQQGFAPFLPLVESLAVAPDGTLWVQRYTVGDEPGPVDIFDGEGRYLGTLPEGSPFPVGFLPDGRILVSETDDLDVERLVVRTADVKTRE